MTETKRCSSCRLALTGSKKYYRFKSEENEYVTCVVCVAKAAQRLEGMKMKTPETQDLLDQLKNLHKQKPLQA